MRDEGGGERERRERKLIIKEGRRKDGGGRKDGERRKDGEGFAERGKKGHIS